MFRRRQTKEVPQKRERALRQLARGQETAERRQETVAVFCLNNKANNNNNK